MAKLAGAGGELADEPVIDRRVPEASHSARIRTGLPTASDRGRGALVIVRWGVLGHVNRVPREPVRGEGAVKSGEGRA